SRSRIARNAARVLPVPVGETRSTCSPAAIGGQAIACAGVGPSGKLDSNQPRTGSDKSAVALRPGSVLFEHPTPDCCIASLLQWVRGWVPGVMVLPEHSPPDG